MKKLIALIIAVVLIFSACAYFNRNGVEVTVQRFDNLVGFLGSFQLSSENSLIGRRSYDGGDRYTGKYTSSCVSENGRDVIFGGTSVKERKVLLKVKILTESGVSVLRLRLGTEVTEYKIGNSDVFEKILDFQGGGNYIMIEYKDFTGTVELSSEYTV